MTAHLAQPTAPDLKELGDFLRAKRRTISPEASGIVTSRRRLTPGLSRDEAAALAEIGTSWYARLEAGRVAHPTLATLRAVSRALQLNAAETEFALRLAGLLPPVADPARDVALHRSLTTLLGDSGLVSLSLWTGYLEPCAWNAVADAMYGFSCYPNAVLRNPIARLAEERTIAFFGEHFEHYARNLVGMFRRSFVSAEPSQYARDVYEVASRIPIFARYWGEHVVADAVTDPSCPFARHHWLVGTYSATSIDLRVQDDDLLLRIVSPADREAQAKFAELRSLGKSSVAELAGLPA